VTLSSLSLIVSNFYHLVVTLTALYINPTGNGEEMMLLMIL